MIRLLAQLGLRARFALAFAGVAALVAILVGGLGYSSAANLIRHDRGKDFDQSVSTLVEEAQGDEHLDAEQFVTGPDRRHQLADELTASGDIGIQVLDGDGTVLEAGKPDPLPVSHDDVKLAKDAKAGQSHNVGAEPAGGDRYRVVTVSLGGGRGAVMLSEHLSITDDLLDSLLVRITLVAAGVMACAGFAGWWVAGRITRRLVRLTGAAEEVATTGRLDVTVPQQGQDEIGRLGRSFDEMLGRLARSQDDQRRLVQDAGHELRTPLTSLRTNIAALRHLDRLAPGQRAALLDDLETETRELTGLVNELVELAADRRSTEEPAEVDLAALTEKVADLARRRTGRDIVVRAEPVVLLARPQALQRAMTNLVENAAKFAPEPSAIELLAQGRRIAVLDSGPGIAEGDLERLFDRFYRATAARSLPGSGLGLSIVREVAEVHGGEVFARNRPQGGAEIGFTLPGVRTLRKVPPGVGGGGR